MPGSRPIIIIKKKGGHGGHHGGAWKVAYADFVTAMMALFIVLWLLNTSKPVREAVAGYFKDPAGSANKIGSNKVGAAEAIAITKDDLPKLKDELEKAISKVPNFEKIKDQIEMTITPEGLRIELLETATGTFFELGSPKPNSNGNELLSLLAHELGKIPNHLSIEGHTDSKPYTGRREYGNWELSTDRANAARRLMQHDGLRDDQVSQVRGYADQMLRKKGEPQDASNRRISVIVQNLENKPGEPQATHTKPETSTPPQDKDIPKKD
jgi:chemotaxis protein MotB